LNTVGQVCGSKALPACAQANAQGVMPSLLSPGRSSADPAMAMKQQSARLSLFWKRCRAMACRWLWILLLAAGSVQAQSALVGKKLISRGDSIERVRDAGGKPDRLDRIEGDAGSPPMEIWTYQGKERTTTLWVINDRVVQVKDQASGKP